MTAAILALLCIAVVLLAFRVREHAAMLADVERRADDLTAAHVRLNAATAADLAKHWERVDALDAELTQRAGAIFEHGQALQDVRAHLTGQGDSLAAMTRTMQRIGETAAQAQATAHSHEAAVARWERELGAKKRRRS